MLTRGYWWCAGGKREEEEVIMEMYHSLKYFQIKFLQPSCIAQNFGRHYNSFIDFLEKILSLYYLKSILEKIILVHLCVTKPWPSGQAPVLVGLCIFHGGCWSHLLFHWSLQHMAQHKLAAQHSCTPSTCKGMWPCSGDG